MVKAIGPWLESRTSRAICRRPHSHVLDVGCGEQPLRHLIETAGGEYTGFDIEQNASGSVKIIGFIDRDLPAPWPDSSATYDVILCSEVLEHVPDWHTAFRNLRTLVADDGRVVITVPFIFPIHMEPLDFFRGTSYTIEVLAKQHGFVVEELVKLGDARDVLSTVLEDVSILPKSTTIPARFASRALRLCRTVVVKSLQNAFLWRLVHVNSNTYLSNGVVLQPRRGVR